MAVPLLSARNLDDPQGPVLWQPATHCTSSYAMHRPVNNTTRK